MLSPPALRTRQLLVAVSQLLPPILVALSASRAAYPPFATGTPLPPPCAPLYFHLTRARSPSCQRPPGLCAVLHWPCRPLSGPPAPPPALCKLHLPPLVSHGKAVTRGAGAYHNVKQRSCTRHLWYRRRRGCCSCSCRRLQCCRCDLRRFQRRRQHIRITCRERRAVCPLQLQQQVSPPLLTSTDLYAVFRTFVTSLYLQPLFLLLLASDQLSSPFRSSPHIKRHLCQCPLLQHVIPPPSSLTQQQQHTLSLSLKNRSQQPFHPRIRQLLQLPHPSPPSSCTRALPDLPSRVQVHPTEL